MDGAVLAAITCSGEYEETGSALNLNGIFNGNVAFGTGAAKALFVRRRWRLAAKARASWSPMAREEANLNLHARVIEEVGGQAHPRQVRRVAIRHIKAVPDRP